LTPRQDSRDHFFRLSHLMKGSNRKVGSHGAVSAPSTSVAAEATRRGYVCKVIKVQFRNRLERFAGGGFTEAFGQGVGPRSILGLQLDQFGHGIRPASCPAAAAVRARVPPTAITTRWRPLEPRTAVARATDLGAKLLAVGPDGALPKVVKASLKLLVRPNTVHLGHFSECRAAFIKRFLHHRRTPNGAN